MIFPPLLALLGWVPLVLFLFRRLPARVALLVNFVGGWAILPAANYAPSSDPFPYWIVGTSLESNYFITKATVVGFSGLLAVCLFDRSRLKGFRLTIWDLAMGMWLIAPALSAIANPDHFAEGFLGEIYQLLAWGSPYLIGRLYFTDTKSLRLAATAFVIAGLAYIPICIFEFFAGPQLYARIYGYQPFRLLSAARFIGYRPIGLLENGNQLGIWMATAALIATWLWRRKATPAILGIPIFLAAILLLAISVLCQSTGAIILLFAFIPFAFVHPRYLSRTVSIFLVFAILAFAAFRIGNVLSWQSLTQRSPAARGVADYLKKMGKDSLGWRLSQDERHLDTALEEPILGYGQWDWWRSGVQRPWSLWLLVFGMYGSVGLIALEATLLIPAVRVMWFPLTPADTSYSNMRHTLSAAVLMTAIDSLLNSSVILPLLLVIGGMSVWQAAEASIEVEYVGPRASTGTTFWRGSENPRRKRH
jgi:hypothetical protein